MWVFNSCRLIILHIVFQLLFLILHFYSQHFRLYSRHFDTEHPRAQLYLMNMNINFLALQNVPDWCSCFSTTGVSLRNPGYLISQFKTLRAHSVSMNICISHWQTAVTARTSHINAPHCFTLIVKVSKLAPCTRHWIADFVSMYFMFWEVWRWHVHMILVIR